MKSVGVYRDTYFTFYCVSSKWSAMDGTDKNIKSCGRYWQSDMQI